MQRQVDDMLSERVKQEVRHFSASRAFKQLRHLGRLCVWPTSQD